MNIYTNRLLIKRMNDHDLYFGYSGYVVTDETWHCADVCSPFSRLYFVESGRALLHTDTETIELTPGHAYLIPPGLRYTYAGAPSVEKLYFHINIFRPDGFDMMLDLKTVAELPYSIADTARLCELYKSERFSDTIVLKGIVSGVVAEIASKYGVGSGSTENYSPLVAEAMRYIRAHLSVQLTTASVAEALFVSVSTLSKAFKEETGHTVNAYIDELVVYSAERKLLRSAMSVREIGEKLGFCDQFYFSRSFKKHTGMSPMMYRKRMEAIDGGME